MTIASLTGYEPGAVLYFFIGVSQPIFSHSYYFYRRRQPLQFSNITIIVADHHNFPISPSLPPTTLVFQYYYRRRRPP